MTTRPRLVWLLVLLVLLLVSSSTSTPTPLYVDLTGGIPTGPCPRPSPCTLTRALFLANETDEMEIEIVFANSLGNLAQGWGVTYAVEHAGMDLTFRAEEGVSLVVGAGVDFLLRSVSANNGTDADLMNVTFVDITFVDMLGQKNALGPDAQLGLIEDTAPLGVYFVRCVFLNCFASIAGGSASGSGSAVAVHLTDCVVANSTLVVGVGVGNVNASLVEIVVRNTSVVGSAKMHLEGGNGDLFSYFLEHPASDFDNLYLVGLFFSIGIQSPSAALTRIQLDSVSFEGAGMGLFASGDLEIVVDGVAAQSVFYEDDFHGMWHLGMDDPSVLCPGLGLRFQALGSLAATVSDSTFDGLVGPCVGVAARFAAPVVGVEVHACSFVDNVGILGSGFSVEAVSDASVAVSDSSFRNQNGYALSKAGWASRNAPTRGLAFAVGVLSADGNASVSVSGTRILSPHLSNPEGWYESEAVSTGIYVKVRGACDVLLEDVTYEEFGPSVYVPPWVSQNSLADPSFAKLVARCPECYEFRRWTGGWLTVLGDSVTVTISRSDLVSGLYQSSMLDACVLNLTVTESSFVSVIVEAIETIIGGSFDEADEFVVADARGGAFAVVQRSCESGSVDVSVEDSVFSGFAVGGYGGSLLVEAHSPSLVQVRNTSFEGCYAAQGAAIAFTGTEHRITDLVLDEVTINDNAASVAAAGVFAVKTTTTVRNSTFARCTAPRGAAFVASGSEVLFYRVLMSQNVAELEAGGALFVQTEASIVESVFDGNQVTVGCDDCAGGGSLAGVYTRDFTAAVSGFDITTSQFSGCHSGDGGGCVSIQYGYLDVGNCTFTDAVARYGGAIYAQTAAVTVADSTFQSCKVLAEGDGGAIYLSSDDSPIFPFVVTGCNFTECGSNEARYGGAIRTESSVVQMSGCLFEACVAKMGGAISVRSSRVVFGDDMWTFVDFYIDISTKRIEKCELVDGMSRLTYFGAANSTSKTLAEFSNDVSLRDETLFRGNQAVVSGGAVHANFSTLFVHGEEVSFLENHAMSTGGALFLNMHHREWGSGLMPFTPLTIRNNSAEYGPAMATTFVWPPMGQCVKLGRNTGTVRDMGRQLHLLSPFPPDAMSIEEIQDMCFQFECEGAPTCMELEDIGTIPAVVLPNVENPDDFLTGETQVYDVLTTTSNSRFGVSVYLLDSFGRKFPSYRYLQLSLTANVSSLESDASLVVDYGSGTAEWTDLMIEEAMETVVALNISVVGLPDVWVVLLLRVTACGPGYETADSDLHEIGCVPCLETTYKLTSGTGECLGCPTGANCEGSAVAVDSGFWGRVTSLGEAQVVKCAGDSCLGGQIYHSELDIVEFANCSDSRSGPLCALCSAGYSEWSGECVLCDASSNWAMNFVPFIVFLVFEFILLSFVHCWSQNSETATDEQSDPNAGCRILMNFIQTVNIVIAFTTWFSSTGITVSASLTASLSFLQNLISWTPSSLDQCPIRLDSGYDRLFSQALQPICSVLFIGLLAFVASMVELCRWVVRRRCVRRTIPHAEELEESTKSAVGSAGDSTTSVQVHPDDDDASRESLPVGSDSSSESAELLEEGEEKRVVLGLRILRSLLRILKPYLVRVWYSFSFHGFIRSFLNLLIVTHTPLATLVFDFFMCARGIGVDKEADFSLVRYPDTVCFDTEYFLWGLFYVPLLFYVLFGPILVVSVMACLRKRIAVPHSTLNDVFSPVFELYKPHLFWYEIVFVYSRTALVFFSKITDLLMLVDKETDGMIAVFGISVLTVTILLHIVLRPYEKQLYNVLEIFATSFIVVMLGLQEEGFEITKNVGMGITTLVTAAIIVGLFLIAVADNVGLVRRIILWIYLKGKKVKVEVDDSDTNRM